MNKTTVASGAILDLVGIGALNIDYIVKSPRKSINSEDEIPITERQKFLAALKGTCASRKNCFVGGSAFNAVRTIASMRRELNVGFVGVAGIENSHLVSIRAEVAELGIDHAMIEFREELAGGCIATVDNEGRRRLRTYPGANAQFPQFLRQNRRMLLQYLSRARLVHVSSIFDPDAARLISAILCDAKVLSPLMRISIDPGDYWIKHNAQNIRPLLSIADFLFLSQPELVELGGPPHHDISSAATSVFRFCKTRATIIVLKQRSSISVFHQSCGRIRVSSHQNAHAIDTTSIKDATGAGDVLAGGVLAGVLIPGIGTEGGIELGLRLVAHKLAHLGSSGFHSFAHIVESFLDQRDRLSTSISEYAERKPQTQLAIAAVKTKGGNTPKVVRTANQANRNRIFISYSHRDRRLFEEFKVMLAPAIRRGIVDLWDDGMISPGAKWRDEIQRALASAKIAALLVSQNFLDSEFIANHELPPLLTAANHEGLQVFWICCSSCLYEKTEIVTYQAAHDISRPLNSLSRPRRELELSRICGKLIEAVSNST